MRTSVGLAACLVLGALSTRAAEEWWKPYSPPCVERENVFEFTEKPSVRSVGPDRYEIAFAVASRGGSPDRGLCDATVAIVDEGGGVVRHLASGVLGPNAPPAFQRDGLSQRIVWDGKDDLGVYVREPERTRARVSLGLKPVFDKLLGISHPKNLPGFVLGIAADPDGVYVWVRGQGGFGHVTIRKFDSDGGYVATLTPPPSHLPESKLGGRSFVEYEPGRRSHHGPLIMQDMGYAGNLLPGVGGKGVVDFQPAIAGGRMYFCNAGQGYRSGREPSKLYYLHTDGSTDVRGMTERPFLPFDGGHEYPRFAASPDGRWLYAAGLSAGGRPSAPVVMRLNVEGEGPAEPFLGRMTLRGRKAEFQQGTGPNEFQNPSGIACDARGRVYVADAFNNRVQVFSAEGRHLLTIPADRPRLVCVHAKTGGIYVQHQGRVGGRSVQRLTKFSSFDNPREEFHVDGIYTAVMAVDSWAPKPRVWVAGGVSRMGVTTTSSYYDRAGPSVTVWEEDGGALRKIVDFDEEMEALGGTDYFGRWEGSCYDKVVCDPVRETLWWTWEKNQATRIVFDLKTGRLLGQYSLYGGTDDIAFDKRGYLHAHFNPGFYMRGVGRLDPDSAEPYRGMGKFRLPHSRVFTMKEVPYDYGVFSEHPQRRTWTGILPVKDQPGAKFFQDGFGVTMRGEVAEQCNIYYVPKMEAEGWAAADAGRAMRDRLGQGSGPERYSEFLRSIQEAEKRGEQTYFIRRQPGIPLAGGTIWTFEASGELREEAAVIARKLVIGSMMDEDGCLYFANDGAKLVGGKPFLHQRGGNLGAEEPLDRYNRTPVTYTYMKTRPNGVRWLLKNAAVGLDPLPDRPADVVSYGPFGPAQMGSGESWIEGAEWMYAGYSPAVPAGCTCPSTRAHLDWFKRSYVPEAYRRSIGVLDTAGNVILRFGRYGNHDDALAMKPGGEEIALTLPRFISGTDTYLCFDDWGERLVVLKLAYHAEAAAPVPAK